MSEQETQVETPVVSLTENAQRMARHFLEQEPAGRALRVGVTSGGCSGFEY
ncbi:MAG TPA: iron-sulfur cluster assembly accessory protein, partial [Planctomycetes bacterium]|nr:iron-sulfur cluster assembly accessory protein [Planctomycetota bacterium]